jgi:hypothetical protein
MTNAERILLTLDSHLDHLVPLVLFGRAAIVLGFKNPPPAVARTLDVDAIIPISQAATLRNDEQFWEAQELTNAQLKKEGLYITHLFQADQIFLRRDWEKSLVAITQPQTRWLKLSRPATLDLILTKMMRSADTEDMADIAFMIRHDRITADQIEEVFRDVVLPEIVELHDAFKRAQPTVRKLAREHSS